MITAFEKGVQALNNPLLRTEVSFKNALEVARGTRGSVRLDVLEYNANNTLKAVYDFKTGSANLSAQRISQIQSHLPDIVPVFMIK
ncbi:hypothetical protein [Dehalobacter restrictus]|uniref:Uncharacterized protein n=1 Tax=Dehalobacter restrictus TaxID=55583 RepID=A0A857DH88_9FIRM|nr:hypothetical protein [Dehalobacter restrictus]QGZ99595.1 hypothetical protein GQ588_02485 [Dehalobacter restrictus]